MKVLIQDSAPDRLVAWLAQIHRPGRVCHVANTREQARFMLLSDTYDMVLLELPAEGACQSEFVTLAQTRNPECRVVDLPEMVGMGEKTAPPTEDVAPVASQPEDLSVAQPAASEAPLVAKTPEVVWRPIGARTGTVRKEGSGVTWRSFRRRADVEPPSPRPQPVAQPAAEVRQAPSAPQLTLPPFMVSSGGGISTPVSRAADKRRGLGSKVPVLTEQAIWAVGQGLRQRDRETEPA